MERSRTSAREPGKSSARIQEANRLIGDLQSLKARNAPAGAVDIDFVATGRKTVKLLADVVEYVPVAALGVLFQ